MNRVEFEVACSGGTGERQREDWRGDGWDCFSAFGNGNLGEDDAAQNLKAGGGGDGVTSSL